MENCLRLLEDRIDKLRPEVFFKSFDSFEEPKLRQRYVGSVLKALRENKFDVRRFNFPQLAQLIQLVAQYQKADLHVFFKYVSNCVEQGIFSPAALRENFESFSRVFHLFVKEGFLSFENLTPIYYTYALTLKDKVEAQGVTSVGFADIVHVLWTLLATEAEGISNPLVPRLFERLHNFNRPEKPLTKEELLELHQINMHTQDQVRAGRWPKEFKEVIPKNVSDLAENEYNRYDKCLYPDVQVDIVSSIVITHAGPQAAQAQSHLPGEREGRQGLQS